MANRYIRMGAAFNGDGTTDALATVDGGVGAWNHGTATTTGSGNWTAIPYFEGTTPPVGSTLPAGTTVYIRSKDEAGFDITVSKSVATTVGAANAVATELSPITWVFDAGVIWSGVSGVVTYRSSTTFVTRAYNNLIAKNYNLKFVSTITGETYTTFMAFNSCVTQDVMTDCGGQIGGANGDRILFVSGGTHINLFHRAGSRYGYVFGSSGDVKLYAPKIELTKNTELDPVFLAPDLNSSLIVIGGEVFGAGASGSGGQTVPLVGGGSYSARLEFYGMTYPTTMTLTSTTSHNGAYSVTATGIDGMLGSAYADYACFYDSRNDGFYPKRAAMLESTSNDLWSFKLYPYRAKKHKPATVNIGAFNVSAAATKVVTLDFLWPSTLSAPTRDIAYMVVTYTDTDSRQVTEKTMSFTAGAVDTSNADWSATTYGPALFDKYKLTLTTQSSVKQDTEMLVTFLTSATSVTANDIIFIDPDVSIV